MRIKYEVNAPIAIDLVSNLYRASTLSERRPVENREIFEGMIKNATLTITAWQQSKLVGISRVLTDFTYVAYLSDLAVDSEYQKRGIGRRLIAETRKMLGPHCKLVLFSAPQANEYYPKLGFEHNPRAWVLAAEKELQ